MSTCLSVFGVSGVSELEKKTIVNNCSELSSSTSTYLYMSMESTKHTHLFVSVPLPGLTLVYRVRSWRSRHPPPESARQKEDSELTEVGALPSMRVLLFTTNVVTNLGLPNKNPTILLTGEVAFPLHGAIVLAFGLAQNDSHPFPSCK